MRLIKWFIIIGLIVSIYIGWNQYAGSTQPPAYLKIVQKTFSFRAHVEEKLTRKNYVRLDQVPLIFQQALISVEDNRFYQHSGIDVEAVFRAVLVNLQSGELKEGGSTISQQLVKNLFLSQDRTWLRKTLEIPLALLMEYQYSKQDILEMYINTIYFGSGAYGIGEASQTYFGKPPRTLSLSEAALIAGLPAAPSVYSPLVDLNMALKRQKIVLAAMVRHGYISQQQAEDASKTPLTIAN